MYDWRAMISKNLYRLLLIAISSLIYIDEGLSAIITRSYTNSTSLIIPDFAPSTPVYPTSISISNQPGLIQKVIVEIRGLSHFSISDVGAMLRSPNGDEVLLFALVGSGQKTGLDFIFDQASTNLLPDNLNIVSGTYKPTNYTSGDWEFPSNTYTTYNSSLELFNGSLPEGNWSLFISGNGSGSGGGSLSNGWVLTVTTVSSNEPPVFSPATNQIITEGGTLVFTVSASDPVDNDAITLSIQDKPAGASFADNGNGTGSFSWTNASPVGVYTSRFEATDKDGTVTQTVLITVQAASDGDDIDDAWEQQYFGNLTTANNTTDFDGDLFVDLHEFLAGTIPTNSASYLRLTALSPEGTNILIKWPGVTGKVYGIGIRTNLLSGAFSTLVSNITGVSPTTTVTASPPASANPSFFRIELEDPKIP